MKSLILLNQELKGKLMAENGSNKQQIQQRLWDIANTLRGKMGADDILKPKKLNNQTIKAAHHEKPINRSLIFLGLKPNK